MLRLAFDFIITWRETRTRPNAYHLFYIEGNGKEGKVHEDLILSKMAETFVVHIVFHLSEHNFRFYASLSSVFQSFLGTQRLSGFLPVSSESVIQFYRPVPLCLKISAS